MTDIQIISWQLTRRCNLECEYCFTSSLPNLDISSELSTEECFDVLKQLKRTPGINKDTMLILTGGEALLRKDIFDIIEKADQEGFYVVLGTNGGPLTDNIIEKLRPHINGISVNIDYVKELEGLPQLNRAGKSKMAAVSRLSRKKFPFIVNTTINNGNINQLDEIAAFAVEYGAHSINFFSLVPTGRGSTIHITQSDYENAIRKVLAIKKRYDGKIKVITKCAPHVNMYLFNENPEAISIFDGSGGCPAAKGYMCISPEGDILPCPFFPKSASAGNVRKISIEQALQSQIFKELTDRNLKGDCEDCEFSYLCSGCRARAYVLEGDYLGWDPLCNYKPRGGAKVNEETIISKGGTVYGYKILTKDSAQKILWTPEAEKRLRRIPPFVRSFVRSRIEITAKTKGILVIKPEWMDKIRNQITPAAFGGISHPKSINKPTHN